MSFYAIDKNDIIAVTNLERKEVDGDISNDTDKEYVDSHLLVSVVYRSEYKTTDSLWDSLIGLKHSAVYTQD